MTDSDLRFPDDAPDPAVAGALRLLAPPHDDYWGALERAIMARIAEERGAWWSALGDWARPAMLAAAVALIAATVLLSRSKSADAAIAYSAMSEEQYPVVESTTVANVPGAVTVYMLLDH